MKNYNRCEVCKSTLNIVVIPSGAVCIVCLKRYYEEYKKLARHVVKRK